MTKRIALGGIGILVALIAVFVFPVERAAAQVETATSELTVLKQTLDTLAVALNLMNQKIQSQQLSAVELEQMRLTLQTLQASLLTINATIAGVSPAVAAVESTPVNPVVGAAPSVIVSQPVTATQPVVTVQEESLTAANITAETLTSAAGEVTAETESVSGEASVVSVGGNWKNVGRTIWFIAVAAFVLWSLYAQPWKKKAASPKTS